MSRQRNASESLAGIIHLRRGRISNRREAWALLRRLVLVAGLAWVLFTQVFLLAQVRGMDMYPALRDGDLVVAFRLDDALALDDVVLYQAAGQQRVGRIVALAGDVVQLSESGSLLVNGTTQAGEILYPSYAREALEYPYRVPDGCAFILGDYRTQATDSRDFGGIPLDDVRGRVITLLRRRGI